MSIQKVEEDEMAMRGERPEALIRIKKNKIKPSTKLHDMKLNASLY